MRREGASPPPKNHFILQGRLEDAQMYRRSGVNRKCPTASMVVFKNQGQGPPDDGITTLNIIKNKRLRK